jgi:hypothetical protein
VREDRQLSTPTEPATILGEISQLSRHLSWIASQLFVDEFARELDQVHRRLKLAASERPPQPVATCHRDVGGFECGGPIFAALWSDEAVCRRCGDVWPRERWLMIGRLEETA